MYTSITGKVNMKATARRYKQIFYFLYLLALPLRIPYTPGFFLTGAIFSIFEKKDPSSNMIARIFTDEEALNFALLLMMLFSTTFVKLLITICLMLWAFIMWCEWG